MNLVNIHVLHNLSYKIHHLSLVIIAVSWHILGKCIWVEKLIEIIFNLSLIFYPSLLHALVYSDLHWVLAASAIAELSWDNGLSTTIWAHNYLLEITLWLWPIRLCYIWSWLPWNRLMWFSLFLLLTSAHFCMVTNNHLRKFLPTISAFDLSSLTLIVNMVLIIWEWDRVIA